jgi:hypothetical protein
MRDYDSYVYKIRLERCKGKAVPQYIYGDAGGRGIASTHS